MAHKKNQGRDFGIVLLRYAGASLKEIGQRFGVSRERIRQVMLSAHRAAGMDPNRPDLYRSRYNEPCETFLRGDVFVVVTTDGKEVMIDADDWHLVSKYRWRSYKGSTKNREVRYAMAGNAMMHRVIMGLQRRDGKLVDHINGDGLDNRRKNLRIATNSQNVGNMKKWRGKSKYKGVYYLEKSNRWLASIVVDYKQIGLGSWMTEEQAARAYDEAAIEYRGEFANLNFPLAANEIQNSDESITCGATEAKL